MTAKKVVLMTDECYGHKQAKYNICTWTDEQQKNFLKSLYDFKQGKDDPCLCSFDVEYDNTRLHDIGPGDGVGCTDKNWSDGLKSCASDEFAIIMDPFMLHDTAPQHSCKCGIKYDHQCPKFIKKGKCTAPSIQKLIGKVLFPDKYVKHK